jgi:DNA-binding CsgD family transcriptional regulator
VARGGEATGVRAHAPAERPTVRELDVLGAVLHAGSEKAAAHHLGLSHSTVKHHLASARSKVGATTTAQLVWMLAGRIPDPDETRRPPTTLVAPNDPAVERPDTSPTHSPNLPAWGPHGLGPEGRRRSSDPRPSDDPHRDSGDDVMELQCRLRSECVARSPLETDHPVSNRRRWDCSPTTRASPSCRLRSSAWRPHSTTRR